MVGRVSMWTDTGAMSNCSNTTNGISRIWPASISAVSHAPMLASSRGALWLSRF